jgi:hypothetical protein
MTLKKTQAELELAKTNLKSLNRIASGIFQKVEGVEADNEPGINKTESTESSDRRPHVERTPSADAAAATKALTLMDDDDVTLDWYDDMLDSFPSTPTMSMNSPATVASSRPSSIGSMSAAPSPMRARLQPKGSQMGITPPGPGPRLSVGSAKGKGESAMSINYEENPLSRRKSQGPSSVESEQLAFLKDRIEKLKLEVQGLELDSQTKSDELILMMDANDELTRRLEHCTCEARNS